MSNLYIIKNKKRLCPLYRLESAAKGLTEMHRGNLPGGLYLLHITYSDGEKLTKKIIFE